jgi:hypothetical protein
LTRALSKLITSVTTLRRSRGAVVRLLISRNPSMLMCSVRGIGVADIVSTSTVRRMRLSRSLCVTPKRCSSSMMTSPRSENFTSCEISRCVPMRMSICPAVNRRMVSFCCLLLLNRLIESM